MRSVSAIIVINLCQIVFGGDVPISCPNDSEYGAKEYTIRQPYDHFNSSETRHFEMTYFRNLNFWEPKGPIYISIDTFYNKCGNPISGPGYFIYTLAQETKGAMFSALQRYYGPSQLNIPRNDDDYFKYLNVKQQLADIAKFIKHFKALPEFQSSKVVLIGWKGNGKLATWMRVAYPELVDAVLADCTPLLAKKDAKEYLELTREVYEKYGHKRCINKIQKQFQELEETFKNATALEIFKKKNRICNFNNFTKIEDKQYVVNRLYFSKYLSSLYQANLAEIKYCSAWSMNELPARFCHNFDFKNSARVEKIIRHNPSMYQQCAEFGQFMTSTEKPPFDRWAPLDWYLKYCKDAYGIDEKTMDEGIAQINLKFGGITPNVTNVVFTYGELSPYRMLGVQQNLSDSAPVFVVKKTGTNDIYIDRIDNYEDKSIIEVKNRVKSLIKKFIGLS